MNMKTIMLEMNQKKNSTQKILVMIYMPELKE